MSLVVLLLVAEFVGVVLTGPAGQEWCARRRQLRDAPAARVMYLPSAACRGVTA